MGISSDSEASVLKEQGNEAFKKGEWEKAISLYAEAIKLDSDEKSRAVYYKNRAAAYLKLEKYNEAIRDCAKSLEYSPNDPKALFRRMQAYESLERYEEAYRDALQILKVDPTNDSIQPCLERLHKIVQERQTKNAQISTKVESMQRVAFDMTADKEKRETAMNNLTLLARDWTGSEIILKQGILQKIKSVVKVENDHNIFISAIRLVGEICKNNVENTKAVLRDIGLPWFLEVIDTADQKQVNAAEHCMQTILNTFSGMDNKQDSKPDKELCEQYKFQIDTLLSCLVYSLTNRTLNAIARDAIMELLIRNIHYTTLSWAERLVEIGGVERLLEITSELEEYKYESAINITPSTQTIASVLLSRIYENMYYDEAKQKFIKKVEDFLKQKLLTPDLESKVRVIVCITALLRGPLDVGNAIIGKEGIIEMILVMANSDDVLQQKIACECVIAASSKQDKAKTIIGQGVNILKKLYQSGEPGIRVRALVGLCKLASSGGTDVSLRPFADGSTLKLAEACRRFLLHPDKDLRKWSCQGLSYLTLDADVKEKLVEDRAALQALIELARTGDQSVVYDVVTTLVNLCNAYEKQEVLPEMIELARFAKQHVPEEHEFDDPDFVSKRIAILGQENVAAALVALAKTESNNAKELIARVFNALCSEPELRGSVVQQGGSKVLLKLALDGTEKGKRRAAQALSRIGITINPEVAFPGQRSLEVIRPLLNLLQQDCDALENFEALLALCNLAQVSETTRQRIIKEGGLAKIQHYMHEDHQLLKRAATQVMTNMAMSEDVVQVYEGDNDRMKYTVILCADEDLETSLAASGTVAILTGSSQKCCSKVFNAVGWLDNLKYLLANPNTNLQYRGVCIVKNMMGSCREVAKKLIETDVMEILMALTKLEDVKLRNVKPVAEEALQLAESWGIIEKHEPSGGDEAAASNTEAGSDSD